MRKSPCLGNSLPVQSNSVLDPKLKKNLSNTCFQTNQTHLSSPKGLGAGFPWLATWVARLAREGAARGASSCRNNPDYGPYSPRRYRTACFRGQKRPPSWSIHLGGPIVKRGGSEQNSRSIPAVLLATNATWHQWPAAVSRFTVTIMSDPWKPLQRLRTPLVRELAEKKIARPLRAFAGGGGRGTLDLGCFPRHGQPTPLSRVVSPNAGAWKFVFPLGLARPFLTRSTARSDR